MDSNLSYEEFINMIKQGTPQENPLEVRKNCPVNEVLNMLQGKWKNHVLFEMCAHDTVRFGGLKKAFPEITNAMLTNTLRSLETEGLVKREQFNEIPPHVEYSLTEKGRELMPLYYEIYVWGMKYRKKNENLDE